MTANNEIELENRIALHAFLSSVFLTLPDEALLDSLLSLEWGAGDSAGCNEIAAYAAAQVGRDREEVLLELGRDRARLVRGANNEGMLPPYESLYLGMKASGESIGSLNRFYADAGYALDADMHDTVEQIGVELAFVQLLMEKELAAAAEQWADVHRHFNSQHLGRWARDYASAMRTHAQTGFYRGIALLIEETV